MWKDCFVFVWSVLVVVVVVGLCGPHNTVLCLCGLCVPQPVAGQHLLSLLPSSSPLLHHHYHQHLPPRPPPDCSSGVRSLIRVRPQPATTILYKTKSHAKHPPIPGKTMSRTDPQITRIINECSPQIREEHQARARPACTQTLTKINIPKESNRQEGPRTKP
jgi:hypothetical protein